MCVSAEERKDALLEAQVLEDELLDRETTALKFRAEAQRLENTFSRSNKMVKTASTIVILAVRPNSLSFSNIMP